MSTIEVIKNKRTIFSWDIVNLSDDQLMLKLKSILDEQLDIEWTKEPELIKSRLFNRVLRITGIRLENITVTQKGSKDTYQRKYRVIVKNPNTDNIFAFSDFTQKLEW